MAALRRGAGGAVVTATLSYLGLISTEPDPVLAHVNPDDELLETWDSDSDSAAQPECRWMDGSKMYESRLCSHFVIGRGASSPPRAFARALACAARVGTQCVLSPEIGLAVPAAFLVKPMETVMVLAPRILESPDNATVGVRLRDPANSLNTRKLRFNRTVRASYMDGRTRKQEERVFTGDDAHCISLLRVSFAPSCWANLD